MSDILHRRTIVIETTAVDLAGTPGIRLQGSLVDERPGEGLPGEGRAMHNMQLALTVRLADSTIVAADAGMTDFPHVECPLITPQFDALVGMSVVTGYAAQLRQTLGGVRGCAHLYELARVMGAAVMQGRAAYLNPRTSNTQLPQKNRPLPTAAVEALRGTCHIWSAGGAGELKVAAGWGPGGAYPAPALAELLESTAPILNEARPTEPPAPLRSAR